MKKYIVIIFLALVVSPEQDKAGIENEWMNPFYTLPTTKIWVCSSTACSSQDKYTTKHPHVMPHEFTYCFRVKETKNKQLLCYPHSSNQRKDNIWAPLGHMNWNLVSADKISQTDLFQSHLNGIAAVFGTNVKRNLQLPDYSLHSRFVQVFGVFCWTFIKGRIIQPLLAIFD